MDKNSSSAVNEIDDVNISDITIGKRIRSTRSENELSSLMESIKNEGLLQPIIIDQNNKLIGGYRRLQCCKKLGYAAIKAQKIKTKNEAHRKVLELSENMVREDFTFSDKMRFADDIEPEIKKKAEQRIKKKEKTDLSEFGIHTEKGKTIDIMAEILDMGSGKTYDRARKVWAEKEKYGELISELDAGTKTINSAHRIIKKNAENTVIRNTEIEEPSATLDKPAKTIIETPKETTVEEQDVTTQSVNIEDSEQTAQTETPIQPSDNTKETAEPTEIIEGDSKPKSVFVFVDELEAAIKEKSFKAINNDDLELLQFRLENVLKEITKFYNNPFRKSKKDAE